MTFLLSYNFYLVGRRGIYFWWGGKKNLVGEFFQGGEISNFLAAGEDSPIPPVGKTLGCGIIYCLFLLQQPLEDKTCFPIKKQH